MAYGGFHRQSTDYAECERLRLAGQALKESPPVDDMAYANEPAFNPIEIDWLAINEEFS